MISVSIKTNREEREATLSVEGHAGYADIGHDIICSSASILAYTIAQYVKLSENNGDFVEKPTINMESGKTFISCKAKDDDTFTYILHALYVCRLGYQLLAQNYPQFVEIIDVNAFIA